MIRCARHPEVPLKRIIDGVDDRVETCRVCLSEARSGDAPATLRVEYDLRPSDPLAAAEAPIIPRPRRPTDAQIGGDSTEPRRESLRLRCGIHQDTDLGLDVSGVYAICPECANDGQVLDDMAAEAQREADDRLGLVEALADEHGRQRAAVLEEEAERRIRVLIRDELDLLGLALSAYDPASAQAHQPPLLTLKQAQTIAMVGRMMRVGNDRQEA